MIVIVSQDSMSSRRRPGSILRCVGSCANLNTSGWAPAFAGVTRWVGNDRGLGHV